MPMVPNYSYLSFDLINSSASSARKQNMDRCKVEIQAWITTNKLRLKRDKTELSTLSYYLSMVLRH